MNNFSVCLIQYNEYLLVLLMVSRSNNFNYSNLFPIQLTLGMRLE